MPSPKKSQATKSSFGDFEQKLLNGATDSPEYREEKLSIDFLKLIKEVKAMPSSYTDGCYARIVYKSGKTSSVSLDFYVGASPGDVLKLSSLRWKVSADGSFRCLTGKLA